jgi:ribonuclease HII
LKERGIQGVRQINTPSIAEERSLRSLGYRYIAGVDEVGRGALMGPVVAAAVILPHNLKAKWRKKVRDSKLLNPSEREFLFDCISEKAVSVGIGMASHDIIDNIGIVRATRLAMKSAIEKLMPEPQYLLIDYMHLPEVSLPQKGITDGDSLCFSIACASIVAKVYRDRLMVEIDKTYHDYGLARHKGYGTKAHLECLRRHGPCPIHRRSFRPVRELLEDV